MIINKLVRIGCGIACCVAAGIYGLAAIRVRGGELITGALALGTGMSGYTILSSTLGSAKENTSGEQ